MPFGIWCGGCKAHIGKGVRYNAQKKANGKYLSTTIWNFRMKCHLCSNWIEIETDPKNADYIVVSGATRKTDTWTPDEESGLVKIATDEEQKKLEEDAFYQLEHKNVDEQKKVAAVPVLNSLLDLKEQTTKDDYEMSNILRKKFRV